MNRTKMLLLVSMSFSLLFIGTLSTVAHFQDTGSANIEARAGNLDISMTTNGVTYTGKGTHSIASYTGLIANKEYVSTTSLSNTGDLPLKYTVVKSSSSYAIESLMIATVKINDSVVYSGPFSSFELPKQTMSPNETHNFSLTLVLPYNERVASVERRTSYSYLEFKVVSL